MKTFFKLMTILSVFTFSTLPATANVDKQPVNTEDVSNNKDTHQETTKTPAADSQYEPSDDIKITP
ncbi:hypothetical protein [Arsenophonus nasoniae]|uniref:Uncharacterized protein n=1 Tax=Arsenophonus nasoniae TaxID=638 RepID=A0AA95GKH1_9GAMM|nr:hypothetical protein [Arsenophonus nasoniae]WGM00178.1 hypothetical protein QE210_09745 [Arsenophonus nasoniae]